MGKRKADGGEARRTLSVVLDVGFLREAKSLSDATAVRATPAPALPLVPHDQTKCSRAAVRVRTPCLHRNIDLARRLRRFRQLVGQIGRAAALFSVDELVVRTPYRRVVAPPSCRRNCVHRVQPQYRTPLSAPRFQLLDTPGPLPAWLREANATCSSLAAALLEYQDTPQYIRKCARGASGGPAS